MKEISLYEAREQLGITQLDMATQLGISRQTYAKIEQNPESMTIETARKISSIFGRKYEDVFFSNMVN